MRKRTDALFIPLLEAAKILGLDRTTAYRLAKQGRFPGLVRVGKRFLVSRATLEQLFGGPLPEAQETAETVKP